MRAGGDCRKIFILSNSDFSHVAFSDLQDFCHGSGRKRVEKRRIRFFMSDGVWVAVCLSVCMHQGLFIYLTIGRTMHCDAFIGDFNFASIFFLEHESFFGGFRENCIMKMWVGFRMHLQLHRYFIGSVSGALLPIMTCTL